MALLYEGQSDDALRCLREAVRLRPHDAGPLLDLAEALYSRGSSAEADAAHARALELDPTAAARHPVQHARQTIVVQRIREEVAVRDRSGRTGTRTVLSGLLAASDALVGSWHMLRRLSRLWWIAGGVAPLSSPHRLLAGCEPEPIVPGAGRGALPSSRADAVLLASRLKFVIPRLEYLDRQRVTRRTGADRHVLG